MDFLHSRLCDFDYYYSVTYVCVYVFAAIHPFSDICLTMVPVVTRGTAMEVEGEGEVVVAAVDGMSTMIGQYGEGTKSQAHQGAPHWKTGINHCPEMKG